MSDDLNSKFNLVVQQDQVTALSTELLADNAKKDFGIARSAMAEVVDVASKGVSDLASLSFQSQNPENYAALAAMITAAATASRAFLSLHKQYQELEAPNGNKDGTPGSLHNHIHLGGMSTNDVKEFLKGLKSD